MKRPMVDVDPGSVRAIVRLFDLEHSLNAALQANCMSRLVPAIAIVHPYSCDEFGFAIV